MFEVVSGDIPHNIFYPARLRQSYNFKPGIRDPTGTLYITGQRM